MNFIQTIEGSPFPIVIGGVFASLFILFKKRDWENFSKNERFLLGIGAPLLGVLFGALTWALSNSWVLAYAVSSLSTVVLISLFTDVKWRMVRSDVLWVFSAVSIIYWPLVPQYLLIPFVCALGVGVAGMLFPFFGQSDARAFIMGVSVTVPAAGFLSVIYGLAAVGSLLILYIIGYLFQATVIRKVSFSKASEASVPAVPLISSGFLIGVILAF